MGEIIKLTYDGHDFELDDEGYYCDIQRVIGIRACLFFAQLAGYESLVDLKNRVSQGMGPLENSHMDVSAHMADEIFRGIKIYKKGSARDGN